MGFPYLLEGTNDEATSQINGMKIHSALPLDEDFATDVTDVSLDCLW